MLPAVRGNMKLAIALAAALLLVYWHGRALRVGGVTAGPTERMVM